MSEREYLILRAAEEAERVEAAGDPKVAAIHAAMAIEYSRRCSQPRFDRRR
jgi:hypothetical protein